MTNHRENIEKFFVKMSCLFYKNPLITLSIASLLLGFLLFHLPNVSFNGSSKALLRKDDGTLKAYDDFKGQFGRSAFILIAIKAPKIFDDAFLTKLKSFHNDLSKEVPYLRTVKSLINARYTFAEGDTIFSDDLLKGWPERDVNLTEIEKFVVNNPFYINNLITKDGKITAVLLEMRATVKTIVNDAENENDLLAGFDEDMPDEKIKTGGAKALFKITPMKNKKIIEAIYRIVDRYQSPNFSMAISGGQVLIDAYNRATSEDMQRCLLYGTITVILFLSILFRRISGVILPVIIVELSVFATLGLMALFDTPVNCMSMVMPAFLLVVGIADSVHILSIFYQNLQKGSNKKDAIADALGHSGLAIVLTSLTTAAGLLSFSFAELGALSDMGIFSAAGVILALLCTIIMFPPIIAITPIKQKKIKENNSQLIEPILQLFVDLSTTHPKKILFICMGIFLASGLYVGNLKFSHNQLDFIPKASNVRKDISFIDRELKGITSLEVVVDTNKKNGLYEPEILNRIEKLSLKIKQNNDIEIGQIFSLNDIVKELNQALHGNNPDFYYIPQDRKAVAQELFLFEASNQATSLESIVDSQFSKTRVTIKTPTVDAVIFKDFIKDVKHLFENTFSGKAEITITGGMAILARVVPTALRSMAESYVIAFFVITIMMIILVGSFKIGLISMLPNLLPILMGMGIMGAVGIPLNLTTLMIGSIAIGLVVDDTVHFMYNFQKYYRITGETYKAIQETLFTAGRAMLITSMILSSGFFVLIFAASDYMALFGIFSGMIIIFALLSDFLLAPALMVLMHPSKKIKI